MPFVRIAPLLILFALAGCGGGEGGPERNDVQRQEEQILKQADALAKEAENGTAAIERALENEGAIIFENREALLNETGNGAQGNSQGR